MRFTLQCMACSSWSQCGGWTAVMLTGKRMRSQLFLQRSCSLASCSLARRVSLRKVQGNRNYKRKGVIISVKRKIGMEKCQAITNLWIRQLLSVSSSSLSWAFKHNMKANFFFLWHRAVVSYYYHLLNCKTSHAEAAPQEIKSESLGETRHKHQCF